MITLKNIEYIIRDLYPTGRAWNYIRGSDDSVGESESFVDGNNESFVDGNGEPFIDGAGIFKTNDKKYLSAIASIIFSFYEEIYKIPAQRFPDNNLFDTNDLDNWERIYGIQSNTNRTDEERKLAIMAKRSYPNGILERGSYEFIQKQLNANGFDVFVHENRFWNGLEFAPIQAQGGQYNVMVYNGAAYNSTGIDYTEIVKNYIKSEKDQKMIIPNTNYMSNTFFIGGENFPEKANVNQSRKDEFRHLILKLKHQHVIAINLINYI